jgi:hypothetical protein
MKLETIAAAVAAASGKAACCRQSLLLPLPLAGKPFAAVAEAETATARVEPQYIKPHNASGVCQFAKLNGTINFESVNLQIDVLKVDNNSRI